jgi:hypothetical protein
VLLLGQEFIIEGASVQRCINSASGQRARQVLQEFPSVRGVEDLLVLSVGTPAEQTVRAAGYCRQRRLYAQRLKTVRICATCLLQNRPIRAT